MLGKLTYLCGSGLRFISREFNKTFNVSRKTGKFILNYDFKGYFLKKEYRGIYLIPFSLQATHVLVGSSKTLTQILIIFLICIAILILLNNETYVKRIK